MGVAGSTAARAEQAALSFGAERAFSSADEMIESGTVNVLHVCTPNHLHAPLVMKALDAGLSVVCEKPLATDAPTAELMAGRAADMGLLGTVPFVYRFHPMVREARARLAELGRVSLIQGGYLQDWLLAPEDDNWRVNPDLGGAGRAIGDIGSHWLDLVEFITGDPIVRVSAQTAVVVADRATNSPVLTEDVATIHFSTTAGALGTAAVSQVAPGRKNRLFLEISGTAASVAFDQERPDLLWVGERSGSWLLQRDPETLADAARRYSPLPAGHPLGYHDCFAAFVTDTYAALRGDSPEGLPTFEAGARAATLTEAVLHSAENGRWVPC